MNTTDTENTPNKSVLTENQPAVSENPEAQNTESAVIVAKENNVDEVKEMKASEKEAEIPSEAQKEAIEILNVEVLPAIPEPIKPDESKAAEEAMESEDIEENTKNIENKSVEKEQTQFSQESEINVVQESKDNEDVEQVEAETKQNETSTETSNETNEMETDETEIPNNKPLENPTQTIGSLTAAKSSGLGLLAQYDSDNEDKNSDNDSVIEVPMTSGQDYRNQVVEINSDSDSDDSSNSSDVEYLNELRKTIEKRIEVADEDEDENEEANEEGGKKKPKQRLRVKGELLLEDLPPIHELKITVPEDECIEFGKVHSIVDQLVLVSALPNSILLDLETVIFLEKGQKVLGEVFDVLGQVADPLYCIRFNSNKQIKEKQINVGDVVYVAPKTQYTQYVILSNLIKVKGSDASWENDIEPPPRFLDYSDDEQEQLAKRQLRKKDLPADNDDPSKRPRTQGEENTSNANNRSASQGNSQYNRRGNNKRGGPSGHYNANNRPRHNGPQNQHQQQQHHQPQRGPNHNRNSWHSNYYPQPYHHSGPANYGMPPVQPHTSQQYPAPSHVPMYGMPPNMPYPPPPQQYGAPPMMHQPIPPQLMPNSFSIRPPTLHGPPPSHHSHSQQYTSSPPPPPGSQ